MSDNHNKLYHRKNFNHWKISDLSLTSIIFLFLTLTQTLTRHTYLNMNS